MGNLPAGAVGECCAGNERLVSLAGMGLTRSQILDGLALVAVAVAWGEAQEGVLFCYTGTGASMTANKVPGIRAALCSDAQTAQGARWWNDANILVLSLRATSPDVVKEILDAWFSEAVRPDEIETINHLTEIEARHTSK